MREVRFVLMNPSGNLTCLVTEPVDPRERPGVTAALMDRCEQVGYLLPSRDSRARIRLEMMGGEFCGNATMAAAVYAAEREGARETAETEMLLEVSGAERPVSCCVRKERDFWTGMVEMPLPGEITVCEIRGRKLTAVFLPGMVHLIHSGEKVPREEAEALLREAGDLFSEPAVGLLQWRERTDFSGNTAEEAEKDRPPDIIGEMIPLVWVRGSDTMVWESACGSGTAAAACWKSRTEGRSLSLSAIQPGGTLRAEAEWHQDRVSGVRLRGTVHPGKEEILVV